MLTNLKIKNIVLIDALEVDFAPGYTALTGETGAGKSIILSALGLLLGKKADGSILRFGAASGEVSGEFANNDRISAILAANEIEADGNLLIRRKISADGKSKSFINDTAVSLKILAEIAPHLVEIHSQHEQSVLLEPASQRDIIDKFAGLDAELDAIAATYYALKTTEKELEERKKAILEAKREEDYLRHAHAEISAFNPTSGEEELLADKRRAMMDFEKTALLIQDALEELTQGKNVDSAIISAQKTLIKSGNKIFDEVINTLERASVEVTEAMAGLERLSSAGEYNERELENIEERLFALRDMARKYARPADELSALKDEIATKLQALKTEEGDLEALGKKHKALVNEYNMQAAEITAARKKAAEKLEKLLVAELKPLAMQGTKFAVKFSQTEPTAKGVDKVEFQASTNPGVPIRPLADVASGGEISRFMLALKVVLIGASSAPTVIFDEIDTGTGGAVAAAIGERLAKLGKNLQVFVVTHLPQVAALATNHLKVSKTTVKGSNVTGLEELNASMRKEELARMLAGADITKEARAAAGKLLAST